jgi:hypothetical protein
MNVEMGEADYFRRREQDKRQLADRASRRSIRNLHLNMTDRYRELAQKAQLNQIGQYRDRPPSVDAAA